MTRRIFFQALVGSSASAAIVSADTTPTVEHWGKASEYWVDGEEGEDHDDLSTHYRPHKTLDFMNKDSHNHRQYLLHIRRPEMRRWNTVSPECWDTYFERNNPWYGKYKP